MVHNNWQPPRKEQVRRRSEAAVDPHQKRHGEDDNQEAARGSEGIRDQSVESQLKRFVTFYFTNFPPHLSNFYLRK